MADVFKTVRPALVVSRVMGIGPFAIDEDTKTFQVSVSGLVWSGVVLLLFGANSAFVLFRKIAYKDAVKTDKDDDSFISEANDIIQMACGIAIAVCIILLAVIQRNKLVHVVQSLHEVSAEMCKLGIALPYISIHRHSQIQISLLFVFILGLLLHDSLAWASNNKYFDLFHWLSYFTPNIYNFMMEYQFIAGALLLKKHFTLLNDYLIKFIDQGKTPLEDNKKLDVNVNNFAWMETFESQLGPQIIDPTWNGSLSKLRARNIAPGDTNQGNSLEALQQIKVFRKIHSSLCETKESLNSAFSLQLLASVAQAFVIITSDLYVLFTNLNKVEEAHPSAITYPIIWSLTHVIELVFVVVTCTKTSKQANHTAVVVHKLLARDCEPDIRNQLKLFSIQLLHRKISFTACGFFTLDMTLLQAIIGAATTYLVILIQFHNTYESEQH